MRAKRVVTVPLQPYFGGERTEQVKTGQVNPDRPLVGPSVDAFVGVCGESSKGGKQGNQPSWVFSWADSWGHSWTHSWGHSWAHSCRKAFQPEFGAYRGSARVLNSPSNPPNCRQKEKILEKGTFKTCAKLWYAPNPGSKEI